MKPLGLEQCLVPSRTQTEIRVPVFLRIRQLNLPCQDAPISRPKLHSVWIRSREMNPQFLRQFHHKSYSGKSNSWALGFQPYCFQICFYTNPSVTLVFPRSHPLTLRSVLHYGQGNAMFERATVRSKGQNV
jgi:hypothetical protein